MRYKDSAVGSKYKISPKTLFLETMASKNILLSNKIGDSDAIEAKCLKKAITEISPTDFRSITYSDNLADIQLKLFRAVRSSGKDKDVAIQSLRDFRTSINYLRKRRVDLKKENERFTAAIRKIGIIYTN